MHTQANDEVAAFRGSRSIRLRQNSMLVRCCSCGIPGSIAGWSEAKAEELASAVLRVSSSGSKAVSGSLATTQSHI
jgi:hypothetical protein